MNAYNVNIQMKANERYFLVVLFIVLYTVALTCGGGGGGQRGGNPVEKEVGSAQRVELKRVRQSGEIRKNYTTLRIFCNRKREKSWGKKQTNKNGAGTGIKGYGKREVWTSLPRPSNLSECMKSLIVATQMKVIERYFPFIMLYTGAPT